MVTDILLSKMKPFSKIKNLLEDQGRGLELFKKGQNSISLFNQKMVFFHFGTWFMQIEWTSVTPMFMHGLSHTNNSLSHKSVRKSAAISNTFSPKHDQNVRFYVPISLLPHFSSFFVIISSFFFSFFLIFLQFSSFFLLFRFIWYKILFSLIIFVFRSFVAVFTY